MNNTTFTCCICGKETTGYGNNPAPVIDLPDSRCCDDCNINKVIPARLKTRLDAAFVIREKRGAKRYLAACVGVTKEKTAAMRFTEHGALNWIAEHGPHDFVIEEA